MLAKRYKCRGNLHSYFGLAAGFAPVCAAASLLMWLAAPAMAEVCFNDASVEICGSDPRSSRDCTVLLKPSLTFGEEAAPRLTLVTSGLSSLSTSAGKASQYASLTIVQNNLRRPFVSGNGLSLEEFKSSDLGKAIRSRKLFFVTAQLSRTGSFVSSRYEPVDFDGLLAKIETHCPFDAESLMSDVSSRESAERALALTPPELKLIRWALNKKYGGIGTEPELSASLSTPERTYLKQYARENGFPVSQFLSAGIARRLTLEGQLAAKDAPPSPASRESVALSPPPLAPVSAIQEALIWTGFYDGLITGTLTGYTLKAIKTYQSSVRSPPTGELLQTDLLKLLSKGAEEKNRVGFTVEYDRRTGIKLGLPRRLLSGSRAATWGTNWTSAGDRIDIDTLRITDGRTLNQLYEKLKSPKGRNVTYYLPQSNSIVVAGEDSDGKKFYVRAFEDKGEIRGFSVVYAAEFSQVVIAMSSSFEPFP